MLTTNTMEIVIICLTLTQFRQAVQVLDMIFRQKHFLIHSLPR